MRIDLFSLSKIGDGSFFLQLSQLALMIIEIK